MDKNKLSHDILARVERLRIMHDLIREKKFEDISKDEIMSDLKQTLIEIEDRFKKLSDQ